MRQLREHPLRILSGLLVLAFCLFMISGIPAFRNATSGVDYVIGETVWLGFLLLALLFLVLGAWTLVRWVSGSRRSA